MKKISILFVLFVVFAFSSCDQNNNFDRVKVKFMNGTTEVDTVEVVKGQTVNATTETVTEPDNKAFAFWGATQDATEAFDFTKTITADTTLYAIFKDENIDTSRKVNDKIILGGMGLLSGVLPEIGDSIKKGIDLAIEEINSQGGVQLKDSKKLIELKLFIDENDLSDTEIENAFRNYVNENVDFIIGPLMSSTIKKLSDVSRDNKIPILSPTITADSFDFGENVFRTVYNDLFQIESLVEFTKEKGKTKAAVFYRTDNLFYLSVYNAFKLKAEEMDLEVIGLPHDDEVIDLESQWQNILDEQVDVVFVATDLNIYEIFNLGHINNYNGMFLGIDGIDFFVEHYELNYQMIKNLYFSSQFIVLENESEQSEKFIMDYKKKYNGENPDGYALLAYDSVYIMKAAFEKAANQDYDEIIKALKDPDFIVSLVSEKNFKFSNKTPIKKVKIYSFNEDLSFKFETKK